MWGGKGEGFKKSVAEFKYLSITAINQDWICKKLKANKQDTGLYSLVQNSLPVYHLTH